jgi:phasin family protein
MSKTGDPIYRKLGTPAHTMDDPMNTMNQQLGKQAVDQAERFYKDAHVPEDMQAVAQQGVAATQELYAKAAAAAQDGAKAFTEIADTAWSSTKILNEKIVQNVTTNFEVAFAAAQKIAMAKSLPDIIKLQSEYFQRFVAQATEQTKEFVDLSTRATQHVFEKAQSVTTKSFKRTL